MYSNDESSERGAEEFATSEEPKFFERAPKIYRPRTKLGGISYNERIQCSCTPETFEDLSEYSWEGAVVLTHGSVLQFGCVSFVFSVVNGF